MRQGAILARLAEMEAAGIKLTRIAVESGLSVDELMQWKKGERSEAATGALSTWLTGIDREVAEKEADFVITPTASRILRAFEQARAPKDSRGRRGIAMIYGASGVGKTQTARWANRMDASVAYVFVNGESRTWIKLLGSVAEATGSGYGGYPAVGEPLKDLILRRIPTGGLIIFDHAHLLRISIMEQLIVFPEEHGIAIAFIGNARVSKSITDAKVIQIISRVAGANVFINMPGEDDLDMLLPAWGISGRKEREFCHLIGLQDGGLHYLENTLREARKLAAAKGTDALDIDLLKLGAANARCWGAQE